MKSVINYALATIKSFFIFNSAWAASQDIAQCIHTEKKLQVSGLVKTTRGTEFFVWSLSNFNLNKVLGSYQGTEVMNLMEQVTVAKNFQMTIARGEIDGEITVAITGSDLSPLSQVKDFTYHCKIIAY